MSDFTFGPSLLADQEAEKARAAKIFADRQAAADPSLAASTAAEKKRLARQALTEDVLGATHSVMSQFDTTRNPDAAHNLATYGKEALHPGAQDWEYIDATTADRFRAAISASEDPQETEYRLQTGYFLSKLQGIPLEEAIQNQDSILSSWRASALSPRDALEAVGTTWKAAFIGTEIAKLAYQLWQKGYGGGAGSIGAGEAGAQARAGSWGNLENDPLYLKILELEKQMPAPDILKRNLPTEALKNLGQFMPSALESMRAGALGGAAGAAGAAGLFAASGAAEVALAAGPIGVLSIPTVALLGFQVGAAQGAGMKSLEIETGSAFYDLLRFQDPQTGARINPDAALLYSGIYGGLAAAVESLQMGSFFKAFPMLGDAAKKALTKAAQGALEDRGAQAARSGVLQRALGRWMGAQASDLGQRAGDIAAETSQEVLQQALQLGANEFARQVTERMDGTEIQPATLAEVRDSLVQTAVQASLGFATAHVIPAGMKMLVRGAQEGKSAVRTAAALGSEEKTPQINKEVSPEAASVFAKRVAEPLPAGTYAQPREIIEGDQYVLKAGNKDSGDRLGQLRYEIDPEAQSVNVLGLEKGRDPNVNAFLMKTLAARYPGWEIQFDPQSSTQAALRDYLVSQNPRGPEAGLQFFEAPQATPDRISMDYLRSRIQEVAPTWTKDAVDVTMNVLPMWARRMGMTAEELANGALDPQVFGQIIDKRGVAAQAATGAFKPVRGNDGWFRGIIDMAPRANPSTALHEMTHAVINFARQAQETPQVAQFLQELEAALGVVDGNWEAEFAGWTDQYKGGNRSFLEAITYGLEDYFATGQAPKPELEGLFRKLAQWILDIYEGLKGARVKLSPEMTAYFDNLVGGEGSPFLAERQSVNEAGLAAEERTLAGAAPGQGHEIGAPGVSAPHPAPPDAPTAQFERPIPNDLYQNERRRQIAGARRDLAEAQRLAAEGKPAEEIRAATGWSQHAGEWRQDKSFTSAPDYQTQDQAEAARQEPRPTGETPLGPATFEAKGYPEEGPTEDAPDPGVLFQGDFGRKLPVEEGMAAQGIKALLEAKDGFVEHAAYREEIGWIDIPWGVPGDMDKDFAGGWGISHIKAKHEWQDEILGKLALILRTGRVIQDPEFRNRRDIILGKYKAVIQFSRDGKPEPWLVTAYIPERLRRIKDTPAESVQQTVRPAVTGTASPSPTKADGVGGAAERTTPANRRKIIVRRKPGPGNTLDRNNIKPDKTLFQADTNSPEFKAWFGDSKVVDAEGKPLIVYHGTAAAFDAFDISKAKDKEGRARGLGWGKDKFYFTENKAAAQVAADYAKTQGKGKNPNVLAVYLHISNPITASEYTARISGIKGTGAERDGAISELDASLKSQGIDGIVDKVSGGMAVFSPTQIKSIDNRGTWDPNDPRILYQGERLADSQTLLYQGGEEDEAGMANLKEIAKTFPTWQEFAGYMDAMMTDDPNVPQDLPAIEKQTWYKDLWESARQMKPIDLEDWLRRLEADSHSGLMDFLEGIWNEILLPGAAQSMRYGDEETQAAAERSGDMKRELAETIVAAAQRVGSGRRTFDPRFLASLMGTIRKNPEEYARIYGEIMGQPAVAELGRKAEEAKYADIKDSKISEKRLSISQRAALAAQIRDEKLASDVRGGRVQMDEKAKAYLDKLTAEQKAAKKKIADLTAEVKIDEATLSEQDRRLAAARVESGRTKAEIAKAKSHLEKFLAKGQKIPAGYEGKIRAQEDRAKSIRQQLARVGDYQVLEEQQQNLERRLSRASLQLEEYRARGESSPPELLALRSSLADQLRKLEPRLKAASAAWKDNAGLQTHLAKLEALSQAKEDFQVREAEKKALKKLRAYQEGLVKQIMRERIRSQNPKKGDEALTSTVYITQARAISQIQDLIDPHFRSEKTQKDIDLLRSELEKNPDLAREVPREWLKRAAGKNLNEMTLQELEQTAREVQNLRDLGRHLLAIQHKDRMDWIEGQQSRIIDIITHTHGFVEPKGFQAERTFAERFKDRVRTADYAFLNMRRIANKLDGGTDGANVELLWHEMNRKYRKEMQGIDRRTATIMQAFTGAGVDPREWYNTVVEIKNAGPGGATETLRKSDLLALELAFRNEDSRAAALYGVFFSATERKEHKGDEDWFMAAGADRFTAIRAAIDSVITEQDQQVLETMAKDAEETGNRLSAIVAEVENRLLQTVSDYFPIRRQGVNQEPIDVQIGGDMLNRTPGLKRPPKNGFTRSRTTVPPWNQTAIKLDLLSTWLESIQAQEHYIATAEYAKKLDAVYTNPYIQENIQGLLGAPGVDYVKEYIAEVKNPGELANLKNWQSAIRYLRGNLGAAYLTFRTSSALKQLLTNGWASLPYAGPRMFLESLNCMANPAKYLRETEEMSTFLKHRTRDITYQAIKEAKANTPATKALLEAQKFGVKGLELADRFPVAIAWRSIYEKALIEFKGDEMKAVEKADDLIMKSQPSARGADLAPIYRDKGEALRLLLQFTQSINVIWQNLRYDLPNSVKNHQFSTAIGILISYAIAGIILNAVTTRPPDDETDEEKMLRLAFYSITQATDSIPLIGQDATRFVRGLITGEKSPTYPSTFLPGAGDIFDGMSKITAGDWQKGIEKFAIGSGMILGVPTSGVKELRRIAEGDFEALLGRQKK